MRNDKFECFDMPTTVRRIAEGMAVTDSRVRGAVELLEAGGTIPFIARYRKEATGGLDEQALRKIEDLLAKERELAERKGTILNTIDRQQQLTSELRRRIEGCQDKKELELIYLPFKPKRQTRATVARGQGLQPLADLLVGQRRIPGSREELLNAYVDAAKGVPDSRSALNGACDIVAEQWSEDVDARNWLMREASRGQIVSRVKRGKQEEAAKYEMYFDHRESIRRVPSHRLLAMKRGEAEGFLRVGLSVDDDAMIHRLKSRWLRDPAFEFHRELSATVEDCYRRLMFPATETAVLQQLKESADEEAIAVFGRNLRELLLAPPAGPKVTLGIDPGYRTGCKLAVVDGTGRFLENDTIYPTPPRGDEEGAMTTLRRLIARHRVELIAIGNGTASRETDAVVSRMLRDENLSVTKVVVSESGASVYSASEVAVEEYPELDVTVRGAICIAHRLQDPLAELVKIDPKAIGVGQYQHDVNQAQLRKCLDREVESCVNSVGVDLNMASASLLSHVAGIGPRLARRIVEYRDANGRFHGRDQLLKVSGLGRKAFEQSAGFLRIRDGRQPLDDSAVHPESYCVVDRMASRLNVPVSALVGNPATVAKLRAEDFVSERFGLPTIEDILQELPKPGRDPRNRFQVARFAEGVDSLDDLRPGMVLEGVVTNVTRFGAFVDLGVHQDGLIHVSELDRSFVSDPSDVVSVGDVVRVKVLDVDPARRRIALSRKQVT